MENLHQALLQVKLGDGQSVIETDTVGFIHKLPHQLVDGFRATLEEVNRAHVLIEVVDAAVPHAPEHRQTVQAVLDELGAGDKPRLVAYNKTDLLEPAARNPDAPSPHFAGSVLVSAITGFGMDALRLELAALLASLWVDIDVAVPYSAGELIARVRERGTAELDYRARDVRVRGRIAPAMAGELEAVPTRWAAAFRDDACPGRATRRRRRTPGSPPRPTRCGYDVHSKINWKDILLQELSKKGEVVGINRSSLDRQWLKLGVFVPDKHREELNWIVIGVDVSSSVDDDVVSMFYNYIEQLRSTITFRRLSIVPFNDYIVNPSVQELVKNKQIEKTVRGYGGTRFSPVFAWIRSKLKDKSYPENNPPDLCVMLTDLGSNDYGIKPECDVLWLSSDLVYDWNTPPFGKVVHIS